MKKNKIYMAILVLGMSISACSDSFLDEKVFSSYGAGSTDPNTIEAQIYGLHRNLAELWGWSGRQGFLGCWQVGTDVCTPGATETVMDPFYQYATLNAENGGVSYLWEKCYDFINNANIVIATIGETDKKAAAEARFFRAYAYDLLVVFWGDVPLLTEPVMTVRTDFTRTPVEEVNAQIVSDLEAAIADLPALGEAANEARINKDMARHLAGGVYVRTGEYAKAEQVLSAIITSGNYELNSTRFGSLSQGGDYYSDIFKWGKQRRSQGNKEMIWTFQMEYNRDVPGGTIDSPQHRRVWQPAYHKWSGMVNADSLGGRGNGRMRLSNFMKYTAWKGLAGDIRNSNYNIRRYTYYNKPGYSEEIYLNSDGLRVPKEIDHDNNSQTPMIPNPAIARTITVRTGDRAIPFVTDSTEVWYPHTTKWGSYDATDDFGYAVVKDWPMMRLSETYLLRAEARFRQNNADGAADDINVIRDRAFKAARETTGNATLGRVSASDITLDFILDERARELIGEENRRYTLVRTGKLADRIPLNADSQEDVSKRITGFQPFNALLPIPLANIQLNKDAKLEQNPGYD